MVRGTHCTHVCKYVHIYICTYTVQVCPQTQRHVCMPLNICTIHTPNAKLMISNVFKYRRYSIKSQGTRHTENLNYKVKTILLASQNLPQQIPNEGEKLQRQRRCVVSACGPPTHSPRLQRRQHICLLVLSTQRTCPCFALFSIFYLPLIHKQLRRCKHVRDECRMYVDVFCWYWCWCWCWYWY